MSEEPVVHIPKHRREKPGRDLRPGSATALRRGCRCSTTVNGLTRDMLVMSKNCPLHRGLTEWPPQNIEKENHG